MKDLILNYATGKNIKEDCVIRKVYSTNDYSKFKVIDGNRPLNPKNIKKIKQSMSAEKLMIPIIVNEKYEIIDGQHRFIACVENGLSVDYIMNVGYSLEQVKRANTSSENWKPADFLESYVKQGMGSYIKFEELKLKYNLTVSPLKDIFSSMQGITANTMREIFNDGEFELDSLDQVEEFLEALNDFGTFEYRNKSNFIHSFLRLWNYPKYNHKRMTERLKCNGYKLEKKNTINEYLGLLTRDIYSTPKEAIFYDSVNERFYS